MKKKWTIATVLLLAVALLAVGTWAYFSAVGTADNVITMGSVKLALHDEDGAGQPFTTVSAMPGSVVDKVVYVENVGSGAFYTRVKITPEVVDANGELVPLTDRSLLTLDLSTDWIPGTDGYYYYNGTLSPKAATSKLFNHVTFSKDMGNEYQNTTVQSTSRPRPSSRRTWTSTAPLTCGSTSERSRRAPRARRSIRSRRPEKGGRLYEKTYSLARPLRGHAAEHVPVYGRGRHGGH